MTILREREVWRREPARPSRADALTHEQRENIRDALRFMQRRHGTWPDLAAAMGSKADTLKNAMGAHGRPGFSLVVRLARVAEVSPDDILEGRFPDWRVCPHCGHVGDVAVPGRR